MILSFTGHRPAKLGGYSAAANQRLINTACILLEHYKPEKALVGMALGWDMAVASACIKLDIPFVACVPFAGQESQWPEASRSAYKHILSKACNVVIVSPGSYTSFKMQIRNQYMVDKSDQLIALWDGTAGGTANCVAYAQKVGKPIINCYELWSKTL